MFKKTKFILVALCLSGLMGAQNKTKSEVPRPKLVVGIVVDQMRWDYLYRYYDKYEEGGFKRLLGTGFSVNNVHIPYIPTYTAIGHSSIFTGSVPAIHGIAGNDWYDRYQGKSVYVTADDSVDPVGTDSRRNGSHSPNNLWSTTITDQLRLATNFEGKVVGVSLKDRASILPAGHAANAAFWFDDSTGRFVTSTYYMKELPKWAQQFNAKDLPARLLSKGWNTLLPIKEYTESSRDDVEWENTLGSKKTPTFPYKDLPKDYKDNKGIIRTTPFGNTLTLEMAKAAIEGYELGKDFVTDFLTINMASTDYVGHNFGPNSIEVEDTYLRLDSDLAAFFKNLDEKVGKGNYLIFLSADHGAAHSTGFMNENKIPAFGTPDGLSTKLNEALQKKFGVDKLVESMMNHQVYLNYNLIEEHNLDKEDIEAEAVRVLRKEPLILFAAAMDELAESSIPEPVKTRAINGNNWRRSGDIQIIYHDNVMSPKKGTTHGMWNSYDAHIPLVFMGWGIKHGESSAPYYMTDIAPTLAMMLKIQFPSGTVGEPISEVMGN